MAMAVPASVSTLMPIGFRFTPPPLDSFDRSVFVRCMHDDTCMIFCAFSLWKRPYLKSMYSSMYCRMKVKNCVRSMSETCVCVWTPDEKS